MLKREVVRPRVRNLFSKTLKENEGFMFQVHKKQVKLDLYFVYLFFRFLGMKPRLVMNAKM